MYLQHWIFFLGHLFTIIHLKLLLCFTYFSGWKPLTAVRTIFRSRHYIIPLLLISRLLLLIRTTVVEKLLAFRKSWLSSAVLTGSPPLICPPPTGTTEPLTFPTGRLSPGKPPTPRPWPENPSASWEQTSKGSWERRWRRSRTVWKAAL